MIEAGTGTAARQLQPSFGGHTAVPALGAALPPALPIARLAQGASFELAPTALEAGPDQLEQAAEVLPRGTAITIPALGRDSLQMRLATARAVREAGFEPVPCIAARRLRDRAHAHEIIGRFRDEAGAARLVLVGGDERVAAGEFASALELLVQLRGHAHGLSGIGLAAYPEGHPTIPHGVLEAELDTKLAVAEDAGLAPFIITQFAFDAPPIIAWLEALRARGCTAPVSIGLAGPAPVLRLMRHARTCGAGASARNLIGKGASIARLMQEAGPDPVIRDLAEAEVGQRLGPVTLHLFSFGELARTARWMAPVFRGRVQARAGECGFTAQD